MPLKKDKSYQVIMKSKSLNNEEIGGEVVFIISFTSYNNSLSMILISSFS